MIKVGKGQSLNPLTNPASRQMAWPSTISKWTNYKGRKERTHKKLVGISVITNECTKHPLGAQDT